MMETLYTVALIDNPGWPIPSRHPTRKPTFRTSTFLAENCLKGPVDINTEQSVEPAEPCPNSRPRFVNSRLVCS